MAIKLIPDERLAVYRSLVDHFLPIAGEMLSAGGSVSLAVHATCDHGL